GIWDKTFAKTLIGESSRGCSGVGQPVESNVVEHAICRDGFAGPVVRPSLELLVYPHRLPDWRVGKTIPQCLRPRPLDVGIPRGIAHVLAEVIQGLLLGDRIAARWRWWRRKEDRKIQMNGGKS